MKKKKREREKREKETERRKKEVRNLFLFLRDRRVGTVKGVRGKSRRSRRSMRRRRRRRRRKHWIGFTFFFRLSFFSVFIFLRHLSPVRGRSEKLPFKVNSRGASTYNNFAPILRHSRRRAVTIGSILRWNPLSTKRAKGILMTTLRSQRRRGKARCSSTLNISFIQRHVIWRIYRSNIHMESM